ncbi:hypothetical protein [Gimesia aquarii]|uniref:Uncharacterized protein n=1 Tax=Gimesia aquarii TaxID=2527964 RepID=A0A517X1Q9_9PLAN|nr:hypothetical protein [Gimesia aquarii]QDU11433.1 hypothetical protein V202x_48550 [Gimesia aquarii]
MKLRRTYTVLMLFLFSNVWGNVAFSSELDIVLQRLETDSASLPSLTVEWSTKRKLLIPPDEFKEKVKFPAYSEEFGFYQFTRYSYQHPYARGFRQIESLQNVAGMTNDLSKTSMTPTKPTVLSRKAPSQNKTQFIQTVTKQEVAIQLEKVFEGTLEVPDSIVPDSICMLMISTLDELKTESPHAKFIWPDYLKLAGYFFPETPMEVGLKPVPLPVRWSQNAQESNKLTLLNNQDGKTELVFHDSNSSLTEKLHFSNTSKYAVESRELFDASDRIIRRYHYQGSVNIEGTTFYLPEKIRVEYFNWETNSEYVSFTPIVEITYELKDISYGPYPDEYFTLNYNTPGDMIADRTLPESSTFPEGQVQYRIPSNPADLKRVIEKAKKDNDSWRQQSFFNVHKKRPFSQILIGGNILLIIVLAIVFFLNRRKL